MTTVSVGDVGTGIIPYQELLGNYDMGPTILNSSLIIPYQELLGNYDIFPPTASDSEIIPYQELLGNYDGIYNGKH